MHYLKRDTGYHFGGFGRGLLFKAGLAWSRFIWAFRPQDYHSPSTNPAGNKPPSPRALRLVLRCSCDCTTWHMHIFGSEIYFRGGYSFGRQTTYI